MNVGLSKQSKTSGTKTKFNKEEFWKKVVAQRELIVMSVPFLLFALVFSYGPLWGWLMAFQNYKPGKSFFDQTWIGLDNFKFLFSDPDFYRVLRNTLAMSIINITLGFIFAIILALLLNEIKSKYFKRTVQTISYLPHFLSWIIVTGLVTQVLSTENGIINTILMNLNLIKEPILFLGEPKYFWGIVGATNVWKEVGWNTIIYLAAMTAIDPGLYEAAAIDGAGRFKKMLHVTLPGIKATFFILLIMTIGHVLEAGFDMQYMLGNGLIREVSETIDIYVLRYGMNLNNFSLATAAGMFKSVIGITLILGANKFAKKMGEERLI